MFAHTGESANIPLASESGGPVQIITVQREKFELFMAHTRVITFQQILIPNTHTHTHIYLKFIGPCIILIVE